MTTMDDAPDGSCTDSSCIECNGRTTGLALLFLLLAASLVVWQGCGRARPPEAGAAGSRRDPPRKMEVVEIEGDKLKTGIAPDDAALLARVKEALASDPELRTQRIEVDAQSGKVALWGRVDRASARTLAEQRARQTRGVASVHNLIKVEAPLGGTRTRPP
ncbi:MAG TPA: BON domain-containing protein [Thermoanaerobaculia bacterium]|nr:BON domain-containing protein [Thermoanaerobaculia bacterium]